MRVFQSPNTSFDRLMLKEKTIFFGGLVGSEKRERVRKRKRKRKRERKKKKKKKKKKFENR